MTPDPETRHGYPLADADLVAYATNFDTRITATCLVFSLTAAQASAFHALLTPFISAYDALKAAEAAGVRSKALVTAKTDAKRSLLVLAHDLYGTVQSSTAVSASNKGLLGIVVRKTIPTPTPPPALAPQVTVERVTGRTVRYRLADATAPTKRRRPGNAAGALIMSAVGARRPRRTTPAGVSRGRPAPRLFWSSTRPARTRTCPAGSRASGTRAAVNTRPPARRSRRKVVAALPGPAVSVRAA